VELQNQLVFNDIDNSIQMKQIFYLFLFFSLKTYSQEASNLNLSYDETVNQIRKFIANKYGDDEILFLGTEVHTKSENQSWIFLTKEINIQWRHLERFNDFISSEDSNSNIITVALEFPKKNSFKIESISTYKKDNETTYEIKTGYSLYFTTVIPSSKKDEIEKLKLLFFHLKKLDMEGKIVSK